MKYVSYSSQRINIRYILFIVCVYLLSACSKKWTAVEKATYVKSQRLKEDCCRVIDNYATYESVEDLIATRYVRLNFHIVQAQDGTGNFKEKAGREYVYNFINAANASLRENVPMNLPEGNETPVLPPNLQFVLRSSTDVADDDGIYFHQDDELYGMVRKGKHRNIGDSRVIQKYAIHQDSIINVFLLEHPKDSLAQEHFKIVPMGVAIGTGIKLLGMQTDANRGFPFWFNKQLLTHEVGHVLGLSHSWIYNDGCEDTPPHPNCWNVDDTERCRVCSNNVMDYNTFRNAWTPCQIGKVHKNMSNIYAHQRKLLVKDWCVDTIREEIVVKGNQEWKAAVDLKGNIRVKKGSSLHIRCRVALPNGAKVILEPNSSLKITGRGYIHNDCGGEWDGIYYDIKKQKPRIECSGDNVIRNCRHPLLTGSTNS